MGGDESLYIPEIVVGIGPPTDVVGRTSSGLMTPAMGFVIKRGVGIGELAEFRPPPPNPPTTGFTTTLLPLAAPDLERIRREGVRDCAAIGTNTFGLLCCGVVAEPADEEEGEYDAPAGVVGLEEPLSETNMLAASIFAAASLSNLVVDAERFCKVEAVAASLAAFLMQALPRMIGLATADETRDFPRRLRCLEQYPRRWDSFEQPSFEHSLLHCFPLNFFRIPLGVETMSPFLYLCGVAGRDLLKTN